MDDVADDLPGFDDTRPLGDGGDPHAAVSIVTLTARIQRLDHTRRAVVRHWAVVGHQYHECVLGNAESFEFLADQADTPSAVQL